MLDVAGSVWDDFWVLLLGVEGEEQRMMMALAWIQNLLLGNDKV